MSDDLIANLLFCWLVAIGSSFTLYACEVDLGVMGGIGIGCLSTALGIPLATIAKGGRR
jgi:hypothetical protein